MIGVMARALSAEILKLKRTPAPWLLLVAPLLLALLGTFAQWTAISNGRGDIRAIYWSLLSHSSLTIWTLFLLPMLVAVESALLGGVEHSDKQWKHLLALPMPRLAIFSAKFIMLQAMILASTVLLCALVAFSGWLLLQFYPEIQAPAFPPFALITIPAAESWLAAGLILSLNLWIALRWPGFAVPLGAGIGGTFFALFATSATGTKYYPWLLPFNAVSDTGRLNAPLIVGIAGGLIFAVAAGVNLVRREESASPKLGRPGIVMLTLVVAGFVGCGIYSERDLLFARHKAPKTDMVMVDKGVKLEVLDWGGSGRPLVLLAGLGDTAHVFDSFAPKLTSKYHVYGITRRGFGASSVPASGYSADRLGDDVIAVLKSLKLDRPVLVGHSIAGEELSSVASRYPERIAGLVYLDSAYSYAYYDPSRGDFNIDLFGILDKLERLKPGSGLRDQRPVITELVNALPGFEKVLQRQLKLVEAGATSEWSNVETPYGSGVAKPGLEAGRRILAGEEKFTHIDAPILAIFALPGATNPSNAKFEAYHSLIGGPQATAFAQHFPQARVVRLQNSTHYVFLSNADDVVREMNAFIGALPH